MTEARYPDDVRRMFYEVNMHYAADPAVQGWVAIRLSDGGSDHVLYQDRSTAVRHQGARSDDCAYLKLQPGGMGLPEAQRVLEFHRKVRQAGGKMADPEMIHVMPTRLEHLR